MHTTIRQIINRIEGFEEAFNKVISENAELRLEILKLQLEIEVLKHQEEGKQNGKEN